MKKMLLLLSMSAIILLTNSCCDDYEGYGRYLLKVDCETVTIDGVSYKLTKRPDQNEFIIDGHTFSRGIYRKTKPWLYVHSIDFTSNSAEITFDSGSKPQYPLYVGNSASIFDVFAHPWDIKKTTCASFANGFWLVAHKWQDNGVYFDLQRNLGSVEQWDLIKADIFVNANGTEIAVAEISTRISITNFNQEQETATVTFLSL